jgi:hypothetical protein
MPHDVVDAFYVLVHTPLERNERTIKADLILVLVRHLPYELPRSQFTAPVIEKVEIKTSVQMMNATLFPGQNPGFARQYPNPEADAIWDKFELLKTVPITKEDIIKLGKDPESVAKFDDPYWGLGDDAYMAQVDVFHQ